jgi:O-antigen/teichoic acid export membrane protein
LFKQFLNTTSLKANIIANFVGNVWSAIINLLFVPYYLYYIGAEGYGLIGVFTSLQVVLNLLDSGLSPTLNRELARLSALPNTEEQVRNMVRTLEFVYWSLALCIGLISIGIAPILANYWIKPHLLTISTVKYSFMLLGGGLIFQFPIGFYSGGLQGLRRQVQLNIIRIVFSTVKALGAFLSLKYIDNSVIVFFSWSFIINIINSVTIALAIWYYLPRHKEKPVFDKSELLRIKKFAIGMTGIAFTSVLLTQVDKIILSKVLTLEQFGYYTFASTVGFIIFQIIGPVTQSYFPQLSLFVVQNDELNLKKTYHQACQLVTVLLMPASFLLIFFSKELLLIWTHNLRIVHNTWLLTSIFAFGTAMNGLMHMPYMLSIANGWTRLTFITNIVMLIILIPTTIFASTHYGAIGGASIWAIINSIYFFVTPNILHSKILITEKKRWYLNDTVIPSVVSLFLTILFYFFFPVNHKSSDFLKICSFVIMGLSSFFITASFVPYLRNTILLSFRKI